MNICVNMMVKNEEKRIERSLMSLVPHVHSFVICDTGSEDKTREIVAKVLDAHKKRYHIVSTTFSTWDKARNEALDMARRLEPMSDYIMFVDADMELRVKPGFTFNKLVSAAYHMRQESGSLSYVNVRLVRTSAKAQYHGVTHEFMAVEGEVGSIGDAWFVDHADGENRKGKFERDIKMLKGGIEADAIAVRYMFYLAQSYRDNGQFEEALRWYAARSEAGGFPDEVWFSKYMAGVCARNAGRIPEFLEWTMKACGANGERAEPWMELSRYCRDRGWQEMCFMFAERASKCRTSSGLFVDMAAHSYVPLMEMSIAGYYAGPEYRTKAAKAAFRMLVEPAMPGNLKFRARQNAVFYIQGVQNMFAGTLMSLKPMGVAGGSYGECNPSIATHPDGGLEMNVRSVNYRWSETGAMIPIVLDGSGRIITKNFYLRLNSQMDVASRVEMSTKELGNPPYDSLVTGYEDLRLFRWQKRLFAIAMSKRHNKEGACRQVLMELADDGHAKRVMPLDYSSPGTCEKNWLPIVGTDEMFVLYRCYPTIILKVGPETGMVAEVYRNTPTMDFGSWKGSSQLVPHGDGWVFVVHENADYPDRPRVYWHRFVYMDKKFKITKFTEPFVFTKVGIEYCAGLAHHAGGFVASFGMDDRKAGMCWIPYGSLEAAWVNVDKGG